MSVVYSLTKGCDVIIEGLLYFLLIFAPLAFGSVQILPLSIIESVIFLSFAIWLVKRLVTAQPLIKPPFWKPALVFIVLVSLQLLPLPQALVSFLSGQKVSLLDKFLPAEMLKPQFVSLTIYQNQTIIKFIELLSYAVIFFVLINTIERKSQFKRILWVMMFGGLLVAILEIANNFKFPFVNRNHFAGNMELVIPLAIGYILSGLEKPQKILFAFLAIILILSLFLSLSRAGILCFLGSMIFMILAFRLRRSLRGKVTFIYTLIIISFILLLVLGIDPLLERFGVLFKEELFSRESRLHLWGDTLKIVCNFPLLGTGLGTFRNIYPFYKTLTVQAEVFYAHSDFLQLISEVGLVGLAVAVWFLIVFFKGVYLAWLSRHNPFAKGIVLGGLTGILAILLHSFFDFNLQIPANTLLFSIITALIYKCMLVKFDGNENI